MLVPVTYGSIKRDLGLLEYLLNTESVPLQDTQSSGG